MTAEGYFKSIIRRHPSEECWSWGLEWNESHRVVGFFGSREAAIEIVDAFQTPKAQKFQTGPESWIRIGKETQLAEEDDLLF